MLLGRPWQFDRRAIHDGHANTYSLIKDGVRHKLKPLKETEEKVCSSARICYVDGRKFLEGMKHERVCYALIPRVRRILRRFQKKFLGCWMSFRILFLIMYLRVYH